MCYIIIIAVWLIDFISVAYIHLNHTVPLSGVVQVTVGVGTPVELHTRRMLTPVVVKMVLGVSHARAGVIVIRGAAAGVRG